MANYSSQYRMERLYSAEGVEWRADDGGQVTDAISTASGDIEMHCLRWYDPTDLQSSELVLQWGTWLSCYYLSMNQGEPAQFVAQMERLLGPGGLGGGLLQKVHDGKMYIPGVKLSSDMTPAMSNLVVDHRHRRAKIRVQPDTLVGGTDGEQDLDRNISPLD